MASEPNDRRIQRRFAVDAPVIVVAKESETGHILTTQVEGRAVNVSASGALLELAEPIASRRIWLRLVYGGDESLSECLVVREAGSNQYGVRFSCLWSSDTLQQLYRDCTETSRKLVDSA